MTHAVRDDKATQAGEAFTIAENEHFRCKCKYGLPCQRRATQEDQLCDWCRGRNHEKACEDILGPQEPPVRNYAAERAMAKIAAEMPAKYWPGVVS